MKRILFILAAVAVLAFVVGCGGGSSTKSASDIAEEGQGTTLVLFGKSAGLAPATGVSGIQYRCSAWAWNGYVVTDAHCLHAPVIEVGPDPNQLSRASIVGVDAVDDIAVLRVPGITEGYSLADEMPAIGDTVYTLGFPTNGADNTDLTNANYQSTDGKVSALGVTITGSGDPFANLWDSLGIVNDNWGITIDDMIQSTSPTTSGGSGGPVVNDQNEVVGMTEVGGENDTQNDATSLNTLKQILPQLVTGKNIGYVGINLDAVPSDYANIFGVKGFFFVSSVQTDSPADQANQGYLIRQATKLGLFVVVTGVNGQEFNTQQDLVNYLAGIGSGQEIRLDEFAISLDGSQAVDLGTVSFTAP